MRRGLEVRAPRLAPAPLDAVRRFVFATRHGFFRNVGDAHLGGGEIDIEPARFLFEAADLFLDGSHLGQRLGRGLAARRDELVAAPPHLLEPRDRLAPPPVEGREAFDAGRGVPLRHLGKEPLRVLAQELAW